MAHCNITSYKSVRNDIANTLWKASSNGLAGAFGGALAYGLKTVWEGRPVEVQGFQKAALYVGIALTAQKLILDAVDRFEWTTQAAKDIKSNGFVNMAYKSGTAFIAGPLMAAHGLNFKSCNASYLNATAVITTVVLGILPSLLKTAEKKEQKAKIEGSENNEPKNETVNGQNIKDIVPPTEEKK